MWLEGVRRGLGRLDIEVVCACTSAREALTLIEEHQPDVLVTEIKTDDEELNGVEFLHEALRRAPALKILVFSEFGDRQHMNQALAAGAIAYILKTVPADDFSDAIRLALERRIYLAGPRAKAPEQELEPVAPGAVFTSRELEILRLVAEGYSNPELAKMLWVTKQTIKFHLTKIYRKIGVSNRTEAARWALLHGLLPERQEVPAGVRGVARPDEEAGAG